MCARAKQTRRIGWIGLGTMGLPMALRLADKSGCAVHGCDIVPAAMDAFASMGGIPEPDGAALLENSDVVFLSLPGNALVQETLTDAVRRCRGGSETALARVSPLLACFAARVTHMGSLGSGYAAKLINNLIVGGEITLIAEALGLARKAGLDMARLLEALSGGAASSPVLSLKGGRMISGDYTPSSRVLIHLKDQRNAQELARALGAAIPACDLSTALLGQLADMGRGGEDVAAVIDLFA